MLLQAAIERSLQWQHSLHLLAAAYQLAHSLFWKPVNLTLEQPCTVRLETNPHQDGDLILTHWCGRRNM